MTVNEKEAFKFTVDSGDDIGKGDGAMAKKNQRLVRLSDAEIKKWDEG